MTDASLTPMQVAFARAYALGTSAGHARNSALAAGSSPKSASQTATKWLCNAKVLAEVEWLRSPEGAHIFHLGEIRDLAMAAGELRVALQAEQRRAEVLANMEPRSEARQPPPADVRPDGFRGDALLTQGAAA